MGKTGGAYVTKFNWTIRKKMLLFCILLLIIPSSIIAFDTYRDAKSETDLLIRNNLANSVKLMVQNVAAFNDMVENGQLSLEEAQEEVKSIMLGSKNQDGTRPINENIDLGENGYYYVVNSKGDLIAHPKQEGENLWDKKTSDGFYYIQDVIRQGQSGGGFTYYDWPLGGDGHEALKITYAINMPEWDWNIVAGSYYHDYNEGQTRILYSTLTTLVLCIIVGTILVILFSNHIAGPVKKVAAEARKVAGGDLTSEPLAIRNKDEIGQLADDFNTMKQSISKLVRQVIQSSDNVSSSSHGLQTSIAETTQASRQIAESTQGIVTGIESQAISTEQSSKAMEEMALGIARIADTSTLAYETSVRSKEAAEQGFRHIHLTIDKMATAGRAIDDISGIMAVLSERSREISGIVTTMSEIASQTSLLSLNASIEAARAGEQGRGFAVVAAEVKKLAEMSSLSAEQINTLVNDVQADISAAFSSTETGSNQFRQGMVEIEETGDSFSRIVEATQEVVAQIQEASASAEEMSASTEQIYASLQELERVAGQSAESSEMISASTEEQIASMESISQSSQALHVMATELKNAAHRFKVAKAGVTGNK
jgi:methyl-accepting chemotaxis protein